MPFPRRQHDFRRLRRSRAVDRGSEGVIQPVRRAERKCHLCDLRRAISVSRAPIGTLSFVDACMLPPLQSRWFPRETMVCPTDANKVLQWRKVCSISSRFPAGRLG